MRRINKIILGLLVTASLILVIGAPKAPLSLRTRVLSNGQAEIDLKVNAKFNQLCVSKIEFSKSKKFDSTIYPFTIGHTTFSSGSIDFRLPGTPFDNQDKQIKEIFARFVVDCSETTSADITYSTTQTINLSKQSVRVKTTEDRFFSALTGRSLTYALKNQRVSSFETVALSSTVTTSKQAPQITLDLESANFKTGQDIILRLGAIGTKPVRYDWYRTQANGGKSEKIKASLGVEIINDASGSTLLIRASLVDTKLFNNNYFKVNTYNRFGSAMSSDVLITVTDDSSLPTPTPTVALINTPTPEATSTPEIAPTATRTATSTATQTATRTPTSLTATNTPTRSATSTATRTATSTSTTGTIASNTPTRTATNSPTRTATNTSSSTATRTPTSTKTATPTAGTASIPAGYLYLSSPTYNSQLGKTVVNVVKIDPRTKNVLGYINNDKNYTNAWGVAFSPSSDKFYSTRFTTRLGVDIETIVVESGAVSQNLINTSNPQFRLRHLLTDTEGYLYWNTEDTTEGLLVISPDGQIANRLPTTSAIALGFDGSLYTAIQTGTTYEVRRYYNPKTSDAFEVHFSGLTAKPVSFAYDNNTAALLVSYGRSNNNGVDRIYWNSSGTRSIENFFAGSSPEVISIDEMGNLYYAFLGDRSVGVFNAASQQDSYIEFPSEYLQYITYSQNNFPIATVATLTPTPTSTKTPTSTNTSVAATLTPTRTPTVTNTVRSPTFTPTRTATATPTLSGSSNTPLSTPTPIAVSACATGSAQSITQRGVTWRFSAPVQCGNYVNGDYWVKAPVTVTGITTENSGGTMLNPVPGGKNGFHPNTTSSSTRGYDSSLNIALSINSGNARTLQANDMLVSASAYTGFVSEYDTALKHIVALSVVATPPPAGAFRPAVFRSPYNQFNYNNIDWSKLKNLDLPPTAPDIDSVIAEVSALPWIDWCGSYICKQLQPRENTVHENYGRETAKKFANAALALNMKYPQAKKEELAKRVIQAGIDIYGYLKNGQIFTPDGGHKHGRKMPILLAGVLLNDQEILSYAGNENLFQEDMQTFMITQDDVGRDLADGKRAYTSSMVGCPEWGVRHATQPAQDNSSWDQSYRTVNGASTIGSVLAARIMGIESQWGHDPTFIYWDRYFDIEKVNAGFGANNISSFVKDMWDRYRNLNGVGMTYDRNREFSCLFK